ncbi:MAG: hypothetical protein MZV70_70745 [Desulfobacterales bacterium]|nr:hypothetical protein [Desulfobacterales bacterium]
MRRSSRPSNVGRGAVSTPPRSRPGRTPAGRPSSGIPRPTWPSTRSPVQELFRHLRQRGIQRVRAVPTDDFLNHVILKCRTEYGSILGADFGSEFGDLTGTTWYGPAVTWPTDPKNAAWIAFWRNLDIAIGDRLGQVVLGDDFWDSFTTGPVGDHCSITVTRTTDGFKMADGRPAGGNARPKGTTGDIGAIEQVSCPSEHLRAVGCLALVGPLSQRDPELPARCGAIPQVEIDEGFGTGDPATYADPLEVLAIVSSSSLIVTRAVLSI